MFTLEPSDVIPAKAGIQRIADAMRINHTALQIEMPISLYARYRKRWIPAFAGMTAVFCLTLLILLILPTPASATSDFVTLGIGAYDFDKQHNNRRSLDYRGEYEWGVSLLPLIADSFNSVEPFLQVHPTLGIEANTRGVLYGNGGLNFDIPLYQHGIFTWGESLGAFSKGGDIMPMGAILEFRSQLELGWRFDNDLRVTGFISHISNAHILTQNPGAEIAGVYVHVPVSILDEK